MTRFFILTCICVMILADAQAQPVYEPPQFPGGREEFRSYVSRYTRYPPEEREADDGEGECVANIYIAKSGAVKYIRVAGDKPSFNREVKRVLMLMPEWQPGSYGSRAVDTVCH